MKRTAKSDPHLSPLVFTFRDYALSPNLQQKLDELANIHPSKRLFPPTAKAKSVVSATVSQLRLIVNTRLSAGFYAVKRKAVTDLSRVSLGKLVAMTHCGHCGVTGLTLLTGSKAGRVSPSFAEKVRMLLPKEGDMQGEVRRRGGDSPLRQSNAAMWENRLQPAKSTAVQRRRAVAIRTFSATEKLKRLIKLRVQPAFELLYVGKCGQFGKDQSLTFEFVSEEIEEEHAGEEKLYNISRIEQQSSAKMQEESFASEDHILNTIDSDSDPLLTASYSAATILLYSRLEKVLSRRAFQFFSKLSSP